MSDETPVALALARWESRWLVSLRPPEAHLGGFWEFPGGKIHAAETPENAALRELLEECGVSATVEQRLPEIVAQFDDRRVRLIPIVCSYSSGDARPLASRECRWVTAAELSALAMPEANRPLIDWIASKSGSHWAK